MCECAPFALLSISYFIYRFFFECVFFLFIPLKIKKGNLKYNTHSGTGKQNQFFELKNLL